ncbi:MAG TPA: CoA transferase [Azospirillaceae bacterium]|nr:CoA transferase [Azospirillaceae bacterium]
MAGPLAHLRVLDLSRVLAGPWATQLLADLGAEVLKIEKPGVGDDTRGWGPPFAVAPDPGAGDPGMAAYFTCCNRGKRSLAIDFTTPAGAAEVREIAKTCDVVVENFKVGGLKRYGLDYESLRALKPDLIYCSITGYGQTGPYAGHAGYDMMIQATGGLMSVTGQPDGAPGAEPMKVGVAVVDLFTGLYAANGVQAALAHRDRTGQGQHIDIALFDTQLAVLANQAANYLVSGQAPRRMGNAHPNICPYQVFKAADDYLVLAVGNDGQFAKFCAVAGRPEWAQDPDFATNAARVGARERLVPMVADVLATRPRDQWLAELEAAGVPCGPINDIGQALAHPQVAARGMLVESELANGERLRMVGNPLKFSETPLDLSAPPPLLGRV